jgi:hypothetical protein
LSFYVGVPLLNIAEEGQKTQKKVFSPTPEKTKFIRGQATLSEFLVIKACQYYRKTTLFGGNPNSDCLYIQTETWLKTLLLLMVNHDVMYCYSFVKLSLRKATGINKHLIVITTDTGLRYELQTKTVLH